MTFDPIIDDPPKNKKFPPKMVGLEIDSYGCLLNGVLYIASGEENHPTILLLHGYPGHENNSDLAHVFQRAGWNVVIFHFRGSWGSGGSYQFAHLPEDAKVVLDFIRQADFAQENRINHDKVITIGHSMGGWVSLMMAAHNYVDSAISIAGVNAGYWAEQIAEHPDLARPALYDMLMGEGIAPLTGVDVDVELTHVVNHREEWDIRLHAKVLSQKNLLLIGAKRDMTVPVFDHHFPLVEALKDSDTVQDVLMDTDHSFNDSRIALARTILDWLGTI
jgi:hypothetical protein